MVEDGSRDCDLKFLDRRTMSLDGKYIDCYEEVIDLILTSKCICGLIWVLFLYASGCSYFAAMLILHTERCNTGPKDPDLLIC